MKSWLNLEIAQTLQETREDMLSCKPRGRTKASLIKKILIGSFIFLAFMHIYAFPKFTQSYGDPCYLNKAKFNALTHILHSTVAVLQKRNETYWLDYGSLMGFYRARGVMRYDSDIDMGRLIHSDPEKEKHFYKVFVEDMKKHHVDVIKNGTMLRRRAEDGDYVFGDLMVWRRSTITQDDKKISVLTRRDPKWKESMMLKVAKSMGAGDIPEKWVLPPRPQVLSSGQIVHVPRNYERVIRFRYPFSWRIPFPYKWKCWLPWNYPES
ncbi:unnamed protein product [Dimorphilus gyrociliatus]|uniref:Uncharacterized protein n=1 Tax=Dimorphilus gyrociliatus TaxID=2664684 RepID=A0A7I8W2P5_9ANNE|nr:unnamed protein product [Dimorphilus gyrociliatus]